MIHKKYLIPFIFIAIVAGSYFYFKKQKEPEATFVIAQKISLTQEVSATGRVKPAEEASLAFEKSGKISGVYAKTGDFVYAGQALVTLDNRELSAQLAQAEASVESAEAQLTQYQAALESQQAKLAEMKQGTRKEEIKIQEVKVENASSALNEAKKNIIDKINDAYTKSDDAIRNKTDQMFSNPRTSNPQLTFSTDGALKIDIEWKRYLLENALAEWETSLKSITSAEDLKKYADEAGAKLEQTKTFLDKTASAVNALTSTAELSQTTITSWKTDISTARTNVNTAIANVSSAEEKLTDAESNLSVEKNQLALKEAGNTKEQIASSEAQVRQAEANILTQKSKIKEAEANKESVQAQLAKTFLRAPFDGITTKQNAKIGEIAPANSSLVYIISKNEMEIEADIPEADIAKIKIGDTAKVTLDAYGSDAVFEAKVFSVDPAETIIEGVATYKITLAFIQKDDRVKPGMTANIDILTAHKENIIAIPQRSVSTQNGEKIVKIMNSDGKISEAKVTTGLRGSDGNVEILNGVSEGDKIVTFIKEK